MIDKKYLEEKAEKWLTTTFNITREYLQHRFLAYLYQKKGSGNWFFKGGTALRIIFDSPRFSEDLDFSVKDLIFEKTENLLTEILVELERENIKLDITEVKETTGGYIFISKTSIFDYNINLVLNLISKKYVIGDTVFVNPEIVPSYTVQILRQENILKEKLLAALTRGKTRDFFDLYFILRTQNLRSSLIISSEERKTLVKIIGNLDKDKIRKELIALLPKSFHMVAKNLPELLSKELG